MADQLIYNESLAQQSATEPFVEKQWREIQDLNNGSYSGNQIVLSTSTLTASGRWLSMSESFLRIPLVMTLNPTTTGATGFDTYPLANYAMALKNSFTHLIHSIDLKVNGTSVTNVCSYQNVFYHFKSLCTMNVSDLKASPSIDFYPDDSLSWTYANVAAPDGIGVCHNRPFGSGVFPSAYQLWNTASANVAAGDFPTANVETYESFPDISTRPYPFHATSAPLISYGNDGLLQRQYQVSIDPANTTYAKFTSEDNLKKMWKNYFTTDKAGFVKVWYITAIIELKRILNIFENFPLIRGTKFDFQINVNQGSVTIGNTGVAATADAPFHNKLTQSSVTSSYGTLPFMITSADVGQPNQFMSSVNKSFIGQLGIVSVTTSGDYISTLRHPSQYTSLIVATYMLNGSSEEEYIRLNPTKTVFYKDVSNYLVSNVTSGETFQQLLMTSAVRPISLVIAPFITSSQSGTGVSPMLSCFDSSPATTSPLVNFYDYQVEVSGVNIYQKSLNYTYENFMYELKSYNRLNGNLIDGLGSGLITQRDWENKYCFVVSDLSRRVADAVPKSIQIRGTNLSKFGLDLYCYVEVLKSITLDIQTGNVLDMA